MRLANITWPQAQEYFKENDMVLLAIGSIECHGRHMPLGTDTLIPDHLLQMIEEKSDVLIAPTIPYGATQSLASYPGTIDIDGEILFQFFRQVMLSLYRHGARKFVILNGHGGNMKTIEQLGLEFEEKGCLLANLNWWLMAWDLNPAWKGGHGGAEETAGVLAVDPGLVDWSQVEDMRLKPVSDEIESTGFKTVRYKGVEIPVVRPVTDISDNGWIGPDHPKNATEEWGRDMLDACAKYIADFLGAFRRAPLPQSK